MRKTTLCIIIVQGNLRLWSLCSRSGGAPGAWHPLPLSPLISAELKQALWGDDHTSEMRLTERVDGGKQHWGFLQAGFEGLMIVCLCAHVRWNVRQAAGLRPDNRADDTQGCNSGTSESWRRDWVYCFHTSPHAFTFQMELSMQTGSAASEREDPRLKAALFEISLTSGRF